MEKFMAADQKQENVEIYEIKIQGQLDTKWSEWLYGMTITHEPGGVTALCGPILDQTVLHSVLARIRDMNLPLLSVNQIVSDGKTIDYEVKGVEHEE